MPTHTPLFGVLVAGVIVIVAGLTFFPALALGPILEHLSTVRTETIMTATLTPDPAQRPPKVRTKAAGDEVDLRSGDRRRRHRSTRSRSSTRAR